MTQLAGTTIQVYLANGRTENFPDANGYSITTNGELRLWAVHEDGDPPPRLVAHFVPGGWLGFSGDDLKKSSARAAGFEPPTP
jgi:hypothetical protein